MNRTDPLGRKPFRWSGEWLWLTGLLVVAFCLRVAFLRYVPPGVRFDELVNVKIADHIYAGEWPIYFQEAWGHEPLYHYFHAAGMLLLGKTVLGVRITSICFGTLGVLTAYLIFRQLFGRGVAWIAAALLATSFWSLLYSRIGLRHISLPPWVGLAAFCLWKALRTPVDRRGHTMLWFSLGGVCTGLLLHTYFASRVVPVVWAAFIIYLAIFHREMLKGRWLGVLVFMLLPALMVTPMWLYLRQHPELENRLGQVGGELLTALRTGNPIPMLQSILNTLKMFSIRGDPEWLYNISGRPVFTQSTALLFYAGLLVSLWQWKDPKRAFILLWLGLGIAPTMLSWPSGSLGHSIVAQPVAYVFPAMTLHAMWQWTKENITPNASQRTRWGTRGLAIALVLVAVVRNGYDYFYRWPHFPEVQNEYQAPITAVARYLETHRITGAVCVSAPYVDYWNPWSQMNFDLFYQDPNTQVRWFDGTQGILFPQATETWFFVPDHVPLSSHMAPDLNALLRAGSEPVEIGYRDRNGATLDLYRWHDRASLESRIAARALAPVWASAEGPYVKNDSEQGRKPLSLPLNFGNRLSLLAYEYTSSTGIPGQTWEVVTYWRVVDADPDALALFVHVLDDANVVRAGWDGLYVSSKGWQVRDTLVHIHTIHIPDDLPSGQQRIELGVYSPRTLERLPILIEEKGQAVPEHRVLLSPLDVH